MMNSGGSSSNNSGLGGVSGGGRQTAEVVAAVAAGGTAGGVGAGGSSGGMLGESFTYANAFSGGVMLSAGFTHLLGEASEQIHNKYEYPFAELCCGIGYLLTLLAETITQHSSETLTDMDEKHHHHMSFHSHKNGSLSLRRANSSADPESGGLFGNMDKEYGTNDSESKELLKDEHALRKSSTFDSLHHPNSATVKPLSALVLGIGLSFHSIIEGIAVGSQGDYTKMQSVLIAVLLHKGLAAFVLSSLVTESKIARQTLLLLIFALASPIGIVAGALLQYYVHQETDEDGTCLSLYGYSSQQNWTLL